MMMDRIGLRLALGVGVVVLTAAPAQAAQNIGGRWLTVEGKAIVDIAPCDQHLCGRIARIVKPTPGAPHTDVHNPDGKLRNRSLEGLIILQDFSNAGVHWKGVIYDPQSGKSYTSKVVRNDDGTLKVQGCIAFFCKTQIWTLAK